MFAIAFDLVVAEVLKVHPKGVAAAYTDIGQTLRQFGFERVQGSVYVTDNEDMANLFSALLNLRSLTWFPTAVRDIRAFRIEQWSDFTPFMKGDAKGPDLLIAISDARLQKRTASPNLNTPGAGDPRLYSCASYPRWHRA